MDEEDQQGSSAESTGRTAGPSPYASDFDEALADVPILGWLTGSTARRDNARNERTRFEQDRYWDELMRSAPSAADLTPQYQLEGMSDEYGDLLGGQSEMLGAGQDMATRQRAMLDALQRISDAGGYTDADRAYAAAQRAQQAARLRGVNEAALAQAQARGMGGSGAELAMRLMGGESMAAQNAASDAQIQQAAMARALQAMSAQGALAGQARSQDQQRASAIDDFNQRQLDWRRGRNERNTGTQNRQAEARAGANQQVYGNRLGALQGRQGAWNAQNQARSQEQQNANSFQTFLTGAASRLLTGL